MSIRSAEKRALDLIRDYGYTKPPIDVEQIAKNLNINIVYENYDGELSGVLIRNEDKGEYVIGVNDRHSDKRKRFTIAHEIGHFLLHEGNGNDTYIDTSIKYNFRNADSSQGTNLEEMEANAFAACLLMPDDMLEDYIENNYGSIDYYETDEVVEISNAFQVSTQALMIRLGKLRMFE